MVRNLPQQYRRDPWVLDLAAAMRLVLQGQEDRADSILRQLSLDTITWALEIEERLAGLSPAAGATEEERRSALKAKWRSRGKVTLEQIRLVAASWPSQSVEADFTAGVIRLTITGLEGSAADIAAAVDQIKPAHLPLRIRARQSARMQLYTGFAVRVGRTVSVGCEIPPLLDVTYLTDETGNLLADEAGNRIIDEGD